MNNPLTKEEIDGIKTRWQYMPKCHTTHHDFCWCGIKRVLATIEARDERIKELEERIIDLEVDNAGMKILLTPVKGDRP